MNVEMDDDDESCDRPLDLSLHDAVRQSDMMTVYELLKEGYKLDSTDFLLNTSLHIAVSTDDTEMVRRLVCVGASVNLVNTDGDTPLHKAAEGTNCDLVEILLERGASLDVLNKKGYSPFHLAASKGYKKILDPMVERGARINSTTADGQTALHIAANHFNCILAEMLLDRGAHVNAQTTLGLTALHEAALLVDLTMTELLLERGANVNIADCKGQTPLHFAAKQGNCSLFKLLLTGGDRGVLINTQNEEGETPLHIATRNTDSEIVTQLLEKMAVANVKDGRGMTVIDCAMEHEHTVLLQKLIDYGANVHWLSGWTVDEVLNTKSATRDIVIDHIETLKTAVEFEGRSSYEFRHKSARSTTKNLVILKNACIKELEIIKKTKLLNNFELSDFFYNQAVSYNTPPYTHFDNLFNSQEIIDKFPMYAPILRIELLRVQHRFIYLMKAQIFFSILYKIKTLNYLIPVICRRKILICLSNIELENLIVCSENMLKDNLLA